MLALFLPLDPMYGPCVGVCYGNVEAFRGIRLGNALYSRNNPLAGFVEMTPYFATAGELGTGWEFGAFASISAFNGRSRAAALKDWNPYREYPLEVVDWEAEPVIGKRPLFEAFQYWAFAWLKTDRLTLRMGRDRVKVSQAHRYPLFLSGYGYPLDWLYLLEGSFGRLRGFAGFARIPDTVENRRLAFQRLEVILGPVAVGLTEAVVYAREDSWKYANPLVLYYIVQRLETADNDDNLFLMVDASVHLGDFRIYGEFMGDDPSFFHGEGQAPLWGLTLGAEGRWFVLELSTVAPFTYAHYTGINSLEALGIPMATYLGQDYRAAYLRLIWREAFVEYEYILHGSTPFGLAYENSNLPPDAPFPRAPLEEWHRFGLGALRDVGWLRWGLNLNLRVGGRLGLDVRNGKVSPVLSFVWGGDVRWDSGIE
ncbi:MAG: hypothetical protein GXO29_07960 [Thermotogae bacterium]|nr:hypothetical protein [Thermotogota bacterium]